MNLFTLNVKSNPVMRQSRVESDIQHGLTLGGVGFWQEIAPDRYKAALARNAASVGARVYGIDAECPVTLTTDWVVDEGFPLIHKMHDGKARVSPSRYVVEVRARHTVAAHNKVCFLGTHFVSSAWSTKHMSTRPWRRARWNEHFDKMQAVVASAHADGYSVVMGMDANRHIDTMPKFHPDQVVVASHGIDGLIVVPAAGLFAHSDKPIVTRALYTDHDAVSVRSILSLSRN